MAAWFLQKHLFLLLSLQALFDYPTNSIPKSASSQCGLGPQVSSCLALQFTQPFLFRLPHGYTPREAHPKDGRKGFYPLPKTQQTTLEHCAQFCVLPIQERHWQNGEKKPQKPEATSTIRTLSPGWERSCSAGEGEVLGAHNTLLPGAYWERRPRLCPGCIVGA